MPRSFASWKAVGLLEVAFAGNFVSSVADSLRVKVQVDDPELLSIQNMHTFFRWKQNRETFHSSTFTLRHIVSARKRSGLNAKAQRGSSENALLVGVKLQNVPVKNHTESAQKKSTTPFRTLDFVAGNWSCHLHLCWGPISSQNLELLIWFDQQAHILNVSTSDRQSLAMAACTCNGNQGHGFLTDPHRNLLNIKRLPATNAESMQLRDRKCPLLQLTMVECHWSGD